MFTQPMSSPMIMMMLGFVWAWTDAAANSIAAGASYAQMEQPAKTHAVTPMRDPT